MPKPADLSFEHASAIGVSAMVALQALRDHGHVQPGQRVLITGASGGVGTFAVQIAKAHGAEVTGVCSTRNLDMVASIGADHVIDYTKEDFTRRDERYDLILDNVGTRPLSAVGVCSRLGGILLSNGAPVGGWTRPLGRIITVLVSSWFERQQGRPIVQVYRTDDLIALSDLVAAGRLRPVIDRTPPAGRGTRRRRTRRRGSCPGNDRHHDVTHGSERLVAGPPKRTPPEQEGHRARGWARPTAGIPTPNRLTGASGLGGWCRTGPAHAMMGG